MKDDLTKIADLNRDDVEGIITRAMEFRAKHEKGSRHENLLGGQVVAMIFEKPSLRTKVAFEVAASSLGGNAVFLSSSQILASGNNERGRESIPDIARNLERFCDLLVARVYEHQVIEELARSVKIPVINALCDSHHPTQALADLMVMRWKRPNQKLKVAFVGDGNNVATSLLQLCALVGYDFSIATPAGYAIKAEERKVGESLARTSGSSLAFLVDPVEAVKNADVVYTDTFVSMGQEKELTQREEVFAGYQVNKALMKHADSKALFMHCLPAHRGEEVTSEVMDSPQSIVFDQAECRLHIAKALLALFLAPHSHVA
ncbi:MAG: ornithine carbamoyltransferase [Deltaproteobacteria bacterium]|nr:ornithine carbamoyltransferase [Deltaproteobacteria bacterium]